MAVFVNQRFIAMVVRTGGGEDRGGERAGLRIRALSRVLILGGIFFIDSIFYATFFAP